MTQCNSLRTALYQPFTCELVVLQPSDAVHRTAGPLRRLHVQRGRPASAAGLLHAGWCAARLPADAAQLQQSAALSTLSSSQPMLVLQPIDEDCTAIFLICCRLTPQVVMQRVTRCSGPGFSCYEVQRLWIICTGAATDPRACRVSAPFLAPLARCVRGPGHALPLTLTLPLYLCADPSPSQRTALAPRLQVFLLDAVELLSRLRPAALLLCFASLREAGGVGRRLRPLDCLPLAPPRGAAVAAHGHTKKLHDKSPNPTT